MEFYNDETVNTSSVSEFIKLEELNHFDSFINDEHDDPSSNVNVIRPKISLFSGINMIVGTMIGGGIFASPGPVLEQTGSTVMALILWISAGILSLFGALAYAELGSLIKSDGGEQVYLLQLYGEAVSFFFAWFTCLLGKPCGMAIVVSVFAEYVSSILEIQSDSLNKLISFSLIASLAIINSLSARAGLALQNITTVLKVLALFAMILSGLTYSFVHDIEDAVGLSMENTSLNVVSYTNALYLGLWAYEGWNNLNFVTSELERPERNLPLAIFISLPVVMILYVLANITYFMLLPYETVVASKSIAVNVGSLMFGQGGALFFMLTVALSTLGTANASLYTAGRLFRASAQEGLIPFSGIFVKNSRIFGTPVRALMFQSLISSLYLFSGSYEFLVKLYGITIWIFYVLTVSGVFLLRRKRVYKNSRTFKVPTIFLCIFIAIGNVLIMISFTDSDIIPILIGVSAVFTSGLVTYLWKRNRKHH